TADAYFNSAGQPLIVSAPGILSNDSVSGGFTLTAVLDTDVSHGNLTFNSNGSFNYTAAAGFSGVDSFTYHTLDSNSVSSPIVTVQITVINLTIDSFTPSSAAAGQQLANAQITGSGF